MNNILVKTTFKDHLILLKPFHKFYTKYWNPKTFIYYIGYTQDDNKTIIKSIEHTLNIEQNQCIKLELEFNKTEYGKIWKHIGDRLYYFACPRNLSDKDTLFLLSSDQLSFLKKIYNSLYGEKN